MITFNTTKYRMTRYNRKQNKKTHFLFATDFTKACIDFILSAFKRGRGACNMATYENWCREIEE